MKIDTTTPPKPINDWTIESHDISLGKIEPTKIELYLDDSQKDGKYIEGDKLKEKLKGKPVLNAVVLDWLLENPKYIPEDWKGKWIYFWGTIYRYSVGSLCVRCLCWSVGAWDWGYGWLGSSFSGYDPVAVLASSGTKSLKLSSSELKSLELRVKSLEEVVDKLREALK